MEKSELEGMGLDALWSLHEQLTRVLSIRIVAQKQELEQRLLQLNSGAGVGEVADPKSRRANGSQPRKKYPRVLPKFQNPSVLSETWSGRGKRPRWLAAALKAGGKIEDFEISKELPRGRR
jgi:DNA-binding protein H-NS